MPETSYVDFRMREWGMLEQPPRLQSSVRRVLNELSAEGLLTLKDPRVEVLVPPKAHFSVRAYFPVTELLVIETADIRYNIELEPETRVVLLLNAAPIEEETFEGDLRHHLGHVLLYLRSPTASNECRDAEREWHRFTERTRLEEFASEERRAKRKDRGGTESQ